MSFIRGGYARSVWRQSEKKFPQKRKANAFSGIRNISGVSKVDELGGAKLLFPRKVPGEPVEEREHTGGILDPGPHTEDKSGIFRQ